MPTRAENPPPRGTIAEWPLAELLTHIARHSLSGSLVLSAADAKRDAAAGEPASDAADEPSVGALDVIVFGDGAPLRVRTSTLIAPLGEMLVRFGVIANVDVASALARASTAHARLGQQLLAEKVIDRRLLLRALREQIFVRLRALASMPASTRYEFHANADLLEEGSATNAARCDPLAAIHACARATPDRAVLDAWITPIVDQRVQLHERATPERFDLDDAERALIHRIETGPRVTYAMLYGTGSAPRETVRALLYSLRLTDHLVVDDDPPDVWPLGVARLKSSGAHSSLRDSSLRTSVDKLRSSQITRAVAAADDFREAESLLRAGSLEAAETLADRAVKRDRAQPEYAALLAYVQGLRAGDDRPRLDRAIALLDAAILKSPRSDRALVWRAQLKQPIDPQGARADYERALALAPNNHEAQVAMRGDPFRPKAGPFSPQGPRSPLPAPPQVPKLPLLISAPSNEVTVTKPSPVKQARAASWRWVALVALMAASGLGLLYLLRR